MRKLITTIAMCIFCTMVFSQHTMNLDEGLYKAKFDTIFCQSIITDYYQTIEHWKMVQKGSPDKVDRKTIGDFTLDSLIPSRFQIVTSKSFSDWNKHHSKDSSVDIGHMVAYLPMSFSRNAAKRTMLLASNTSFQASYFNEHMWSACEAIVLDSIGCCNDSVHVFTGVLISLSHPKFIGKNYMPDYYFKVVVYKNIKRAWLGLNDWSNRDTKPQHIEVSIQKMRDIILQYYPKLKLQF